MKVGMNLLLWTEAPRFDKHRTIVQQIKDWGFDGVELPIMPTPDEDIRAFAKQCDDLGLGRVVVLSLAAAKTDPASSEPKLRQAAIKEIQRVVDQTNLLGADLMAGPLFQGLGRLSGKAPTQDERKWSIETLHEAGQYAARHNVRFALEPLNRFEMYLTNTLGDAVKLVKQIGLDNVGLLADTHHSNIEEKDVARAWAEVAPYIFHVHISENDRGLPGSGHAIPHAVFEVLHRAGYTGCLSIEAFDPGIPALVPFVNLWRPYGHSPTEMAALGLKFIRDNLAALT